MRIRLTIIIILTALQFFPSFAFAQTSSSSDSNGFATFCVGGWTMLCIIAFIVILYWWFKRASNRGNAPLQRMNTAPVTSVPSPAPSANENKLEDWMNDPSRFNTHDDGGEELSLDADYSTLYNEFGLSQSEIDSISDDSGYIGELEKLWELKKKGILTDKEFQSKKAEILYRASKVKKVKCEYCGSEVEAFMEKCPSCGAPLITPENPDSKIDQQCP
jgi:hypothetical protein